MLIADKDLTKFEFYIFKGDWISGLIYISNKYCVSVDELLGCKTEPKKPEFKLKLVK